MFIFLVCSNIPPFVTYYLVSRFFSGMPKDEHKSSCQEFSARAWQGQEIASPRKF